MISKVCFYFKCLMKYFYDLFSFIIHLFTNSIIIFNFKYVLCVFNKRSVFKWLPLFFIENDLPISENVLLTDCRRNWLAAIWSLGIILRLRFWCWCACWAVSATRTKSRMLSSKSLLLTRLSRSISTKNQVLFIQCSRK